MANYNKKWADFSPAEQAELDMTNQWVGPMLVMSQEINAKGYDEYVVQCTCGLSKVKGGFNLRRVRDMDSARSCGVGCAYYTGRGGRRK